MDKEIEAFLTSSKGFLEAPAGHGKTHTIGLCVQMCLDKEKQLVLTHTHAGVSSLKQKFQKLSINADKYVIETITGFAQAFVLSFSPQSIIPEMDDSNYFDEIVKNATRLFSYPQIQRIISSSFNGLFVDEYQDCTMSQHLMISKLAELLPTHIFGDPLQGIFDFNESLVNLGDDLQDYEHFCFLTIPQRWNIGNNCPALGERIKEIRSFLINDEPFRISTDISANLAVIVRSSDFFAPVPNMEYYSVLRGLINQKNGSLLVVYPKYTDNGIPHGSTDECSNILPRFDYSHQVILLDAIDDRAYYRCAKLIDNEINTIKRARLPINRIYNTLIALSFKKTDINNWVNTKLQAYRVIRKQKLEEREQSLLLKDLIDEFIRNPSKHSIYPIIKLFSSQYKPKRKRVLSSILQCLESHILDDMTVYSSMIEYKNKQRRLIRRTDAKYIGSTLLTKGLEFDHVIVVDADKFPDKRNFYVAISRAKKSLTIITQTNDFCFLS